MIVGAETEPPSVTVPLASGPPAGISGDAAETVPTVQPAAVKRARWAMFGERLDGKSKTIDELLADSPATCVMVATIDERTTVLRVLGDACRQLRRVGRRAAPGDSKRRRRLRHRCRRGLGVGRHGDAGLDDGTTRWQPHVRERDVQRAQPGGQIRKRDVEPRVGSGPQRDRRRGRLRAVHDIRGRR